MRLLGGLGKAAHGRKVIVRAVVFGFVLGPQFLHGQNRILGLGPAVGKVTAQDLTLFFEPARANAKDEPPAREVIQGSNFFGQQEGIALRNQTNPSSQLNRCCCRRGPRQCNKGIGNTAVGIGDNPVFSQRVGGGVVDGDNAVLGDPERSKAQFFGSFG